MVTITKSDDEGRPKPDSTITARNLSADAIRAENVTTATVHGHTIAAKSITAAQIAAAIDTGSRRPKGKR